MHAKNPFSERYNLDKLSQVHPSLKNHILTTAHGSTSIDFADSLAVRALNTALLKLHYQVDWSIPDNNLCPPIPGRLDYLLHVNEMFSKEKLHLLDIGTGANLIYPILSVSHFNWTAVASEVDAKSLENAESIIERNAHLQSIELRHQKFKMKIFETIIQPNDRFDVVVCNPPFFKNRMDAEKNHERKQKNLKLSKTADKNFGGVSNELWYKGGELAFIRKMVEESVTYKEQVHWFTSLISRKENVKAIKRAINKTLATDVKIVDMDLGNKKSRFIAWSYQ